MVSLTAPHHACDHRQTAPLLYTLVTTGKPHHTLPRLLPQASLIAPLHTCDHRQAFSRPNTIERQVYIVPVTFIGGGYVVWVIVVSVKGSNMQRIVYFTIGHCEYPQRGQVVPLSNYHPQASPFLR